MTGRRHWDALIVGDGPSGCRLAQRLAEAGMSVLCVGRRRRSTPFLETLSRRSAANIPVCGLAWLCTERNATWGGGTRTRWDAILQPEGPDWLVNRSAFDAALRSCAEDAGATFVDSTVSSVALTDAGWRAQLAGLEIKGELLVDASGRQSSIARRLGVRRVWLDQLSGLAAKLETPDLKPYAIEIVAAPGGWWYAGPDANGDTIAIYFTDIDLPQFAAARANGLGPIASQTMALQDWCLAGSIHVFVAASGYLERFAGKGWLAVGDAAVSYDPLSASGLTHALETADFAADSWLSGEIDAYEAELDSRVRDYLRDRAKVYGRETRFQAHPFWRRRNLDRRSKPLSFKPS